MSTPYNRSICSIVIHHMGDGLSPNVSILKRWNPYNYDYPEYDFGIEADGTVRLGRPLTIQGSHCLSDKPPYNQKGYQWWNRNSIGIGLAGDFTKYPMPQAQFNSLVVLVKKLMKQYNLTLDNVFPHGQVTYTDCPGCTYSKIPALKGLWNYDEFESGVRNNNQQNIQKEIKKVKNLVIYLYPEDEGCAKNLAIHMKCPVAYYPKQFTNDLFDLVENIYQIGGSQVDSRIKKLLSGNDMDDSMVEYLKHIGKIK